MVYLKDEVSSLLLILVSASAGNASSTGVCLLLIPLLFFFFFFYTKLTENINMSGVACESGSKKARRGTMPG